MPSRPYTKIKLFGSSDKLISVLDFSIAKEQIFNILDEK